MTRAHRSVGRRTRDHGAGWAGPPAPAHPAQRAPGVDRSGPAAALCIGDVGSLTVTELACVAERRRVDPSSLLGGPAQATTREVLELAGSLSDQVAALALDVARLDPATAAVLTGMVERYAAAQHRDRPPAT